MLNEQPVLIWSPTQNKWVSTLMYFTNQPAETTNIKDIDGANDTTQSTSTPPATTPAPAQSILNPTSGYQELLPLGSIFPTTETWYVDSSKTHKIIEKNITWTKGAPTIILYKIYAADGITINKEMRDEISYIKNIIPASVTRTILI